VTDLAAGTGHTCAIASGQLFCWGNNAFGQLGDTTLTPRTAPTLVALSGTPTQVSIFSNHTCARLDSGEVSCFGDNSNGAIGDGTVGGPVPTPTRVLDLGPSVQVVAGGSHSCAIEVSGLVKCWGDRNLGQCGDLGAADMPPFAIRPRAAAVLGTILGPALQIAAGSAHVCARTASRLYCWGDNGTSQCGVTVPGFYVRQPTEVIAAGMVDEVAAGSFHTCYRRGTTVSCLGLDSAGQLGDGTAGGTRLAPAPVVWL
jgi:alpha-tubulin suppressor-like RCC1 family protein